jgi:hypothetical protein
MLRAEREQIEHDGKAIADLILVRSPMDWISKREVFVANDNWKNPCGKMVCVCFVCGPCDLCGSLRANIAETLPVSLISE